MYAMQQLKTAVQDGQNTWVPRQDSPFDENHFICSCSGPHFSPICGSSAALPFSFVCVCLCFWFVFAILSWNHCVSLRVLNSFDTFHQFQDRRATSTEPEEKKRVAPEGQSWPMRGHEEDLRIAHGGVSRKICSWSMWCRPTSSGAKWRTTWRKLKGVGRKKTLLFRCCFDGETQIWPRDLSDCCLLWICSNLRNH